MHIFDVLLLTPATTALKTHLKALQAQLKDVQAQFHEALQREQEA